VSVEIARAVKTVPFAGGAEQALAKIEQALPAARAAELRALRERILVAEPSKEVRLADVDPHLVEAFETAFTTTRLLDFSARTVSASQLSPTTPLSRGPASSSPASSPTPSQ
jgi:hypothetical protein